MPDRRVSDWIRYHIMLERGLETKPLEEAIAEAQTQWDRSKDLLLASAYRLVMGKYRYELLGNFPEKYENANLAYERIFLYMLHGNREMLADAIALIMLEWSYPSVEGVHFKVEDRG